MKSPKKMPIPVAQKPVYSDSDVTEFQNNPLISALPARLKPKRFRDILSMIVPTFHWEMLSDHDRETKVKQIRKMRVLTTQHLELYYLIYDMIRYGYIHRNPTIPEVVAWNYDIADPNVPIDEINKHELQIVSPDTTAEALFLSGFSGNGKSTMVEHILLNLFPTAIEHQRPDFTEVQVVYLKVDLPHNASRPGLIYRLLKELDRTLSETHFGNPDYAKSAKKPSGEYINADNMLSLLFTLLVRHHVGLIIIDEFQNIQVSSHRFRTELIQMFDEFANNLYIPTIKIGTPDVLMVFDRNNRHKRRLGVTFELSRLNDEKSINRMMNALFQFQPLKHPIERSEAIERLIMDLTAGVPNYLIGLWEASIVEAIHTGKEKLSQALIKRTFNKRFPLLRSVTRNINRGVKGRHPDLLTVQQYLDIGNNTIALKHLNQFSKKVEVTGVAAEEVISDINAMTDNHDFSDAQKLKIEKVKESLLQKKSSINASQTLDHKK